MVTLGYKLINMQLLVVLWLWLGSILLGSPTDIKIMLKDYPVVRFSLIGATGETYTAFIIELRSRLATGDDVRHGVPVLRRPGSVPIRERFVLVELTNTREHTVTLALDVINVYVVGYRARNTAIFLRPDDREAAEAITHLFTDANRQTLSFSGSYGSIQGEHLNRDSIDLGRNALDDAVTYFEAYANLGGSELNLRRAFLVSIQMISEAARFEYISRGISGRIRRNQERPAEATMLELETSWGPLSRRIQEANQGVLDPAFELQRPDYIWISYDTVSSIIPFLRLMLFKCADRTRQFSVLTVSNLNDDTCSYNEPTVHIIGMRGLCAEVYQGLWHDGNPIILWDCRTYEETNQLWTLKPDGTIRANGKCLTANGSFKPGSEIMIYDCNSAAAGATIWEIWDNGTIINPKSGLVLSGRGYGASLILNTNMNSVLQSWSPTNIIFPYGFRIVGINDLCLQADGLNTAVYLAECVAYKTEQGWVIRPDGTIGFSYDYNTCLQVTSESGSVVWLGDCNIFLSQGLRWTFRSDGTIWNMEHGLVLDVSVPELKRIIIMPDNGQPSQMWMASFSVPVR